MKSALNYLGISTLIASLLLVSCEKEDTSKFLVTPGEAISVELEASLYTQQIYYNLGANKVIATVPNNTWDLMVQTHGTDTVVMFNSGLPLMAYKTASTDINENIEVSASPVWTIDPSSGDPKTGAFAKWKNNEVYIIGIKDLSNMNPALQTNTATYKIAFEKSSTGVTVKWADITQATITVKQALLPNTTSDRPFTWFSFTDGGKAKIQPPVAKSWDVVFSPYTARVPAGPTVYFYNVKGARINRIGGTTNYKYVPLKDQNAEYYNSLFTSLNIDSVKTEKLTAQMDVLGYNWKKTTGDVTTGSTTYVIDNTNMFFIKDNEGNTYKFRFTNFYNTKGEEGYVGFEYVLLKD